MYGRISQLQSSKSSGSSFFLSFVPAYYKVNVIYGSLLERSPVEKLFKIILSNNLSARILPDEKVISQSFNLGYSHQNY